MKWSLISAAPLRLCVFMYFIVFLHKSGSSIPFCEPRYVPLLWRNIYSNVIYIIWYNCQICVVVRSYILQQRRILQVTWMSLPIYSNKTKKFNIQIFRQAFQPNKRSNTGIIPVTRYLNFLSQLLLANRNFFPQSWRRKMASNDAILSRALYSSDRSFQRAIICLKRRSYAKVMTPGSWCTNLPKRGPHDFWRFIS